MRSFLIKLSGARAAVPARAGLKSIILAWCGGCLAIGALAGLAEAWSAVLMLGSFGASCVLVFGYPEAPFSQPRNVLAGHLASAAIGLAFLHLFGPVWWALALAVGTAIAFMMLSRTVHPPAGSNPVIVFLTQPGWSFLIFPTLAGALILVALALLYNNATRAGRYPQYW